MRRSEDGFTLIEILVAFAILSVTLLALFRTFQSGLGHERRAIEASTRVLEARSLIEAAGVVWPLKAGATTGSLSSGEQWRMEVAPLGEAGTDAAVSGWQIDLTVLASGRERLTLATVKLGG